MPKSCFCDTTRQEICETAGTDPNKLTLIKSCSCDTTRQEICETAGTDSNKESCETAGTDPKDKLWKKRPLLERIPLSTEHPPPISLPVSQLFGSLSD